MINFSIRVSETNQIVHKEFVKTNVLLKKNLE